MSSTPTTPRTRKRKIADPAAGVVRELAPPPSAEDPMVAEVAAQQPDPAAAAEAAAFRAGEQGMRPLAESLMISFAPGPQPVFPGWADQPDWGIEGLPDGDAA